MHGKICLKNNKKFINNLQLACKLHNNQKQNKLITNGNYNDKFV